jgi:hypothetical protein
MSMTPQLSICALEDVKNFGRNPMYCGPDPDSFLNARRTPYANVPEFERALAYLESEGRGESFSGAFSNESHGQGSGVVNCQPRSDRELPNEDKEDLNAQRNRTMQIWHEYGKTYNVFVPAEQPFPDEWEPEVPEPDDKGRLSPMA